jgi:DedD protein
MRGVFDDQEPEPAQQRGDTELTLGTGMQMAIFFGLVLICALCFGLGYAVGHHGSPPPLAAGLQPAPSAQTALQTEGSRPKPSATVQNSVASASQNAAINSPSSSPSNTNQATSSRTSNPPAAAGSSSSQPQVRPALPPQSNPSQTAQRTAVQQGSAQVSPQMVQIAAVSHPEDAEVLVNALRKRGYAVVARRDPTDSLIHVRIGPFNTRDEANKWRLKLLNDGYNAIVQP